MTAPEPTTLTAVATSSGPGRFVRHLTGRPTWDAEGRPVVTPIEVMCGEVLDYAVSDSPRGDGTLLDVYPLCPACYVAGYARLSAEIEALHQFEAAVDQARQVRNPASIVIDLAVAFIALDDRRRGDRQ